MAKKGSRIVAKDFTPYQQKIIKNYYENKHPLHLQKLAEMVTELFLSEGKKREKVWEKVCQSMKVLGVPESRIKHLKKQDNPELVAQLVKELNSN